MGKEIENDYRIKILSELEKSEINKKFIDSLDVWGKDNVSTISFEEFKNLNSSLNSTNQLGSTLNGVDSLSCSADGSCDGKVILDKTTTNNY